MESTRLINEDIYTNSLLISPNSNEHSPLEFYWLKKNSIFSSTKEKKLLNSTYQLFYQCNLLDYLSTIQLNIIDHQGKKIIYTFGPIELQSDLVPYLKHKELSFSVKTIFNKKQSANANLQIKKIDKCIKVIFELQNGFSFTLHYPESAEEDEYEAFFKIEEHDTNQLHINFFKDKKPIVEVLKKLRIYSYQGNFLKISFKNQLQRDVFLLNFLSQAGFLFEPEQKRKALIKNQQSQMKTQESHNKQSERILEVGPIEFVPQFNSDKDLKDLYDILSTPQIEKKKVKILQSPIQKIDRYEENEHDKSDSFEFEFQIEKEKPVKYAPKRKNTVATIRQFDERKALDRKVRKKSEFGSYGNLQMQKKYEKQKVSPQTGKVYRKMQKVRRNGMQENNDLKIKVEKCLNREEKKQKGIPEFIKIMEINKALKKKINEQKIYYQNEIGHTNRDDKVVKQEKQIYSIKQNVKDYRYNSNSPLSHLSNKQKQKQFLVIPKQGLGRVKGEQTLINMKSFETLPKHNEFREKHQMNGKADYGKKGQTKWNQFS